MSSACCALLGSTTGKLSECTSTRPWLWCCLRSPWARSWVCIVGTSGLCATTLQLIVHPSAGLLVSISLTLQFNLFIEMPFVLEFPLPLFLFTFVMSVVVAIVSSLLPARRLVMLEIAHVLQGKQ